MTKYFLLLATILHFISAISAGQERPHDPQDERAQVRIQKQVILANLENQIKDVPYATVRVFARYRLAAWLWKDGKDETERAEDIATAAISDHYQNKAEIPSIYYQDVQLFVLLNSHAKELAKRLREKYGFAEDDPRLLPYLLEEKDGVKLAVDAAIRLLERRNEKSPDIVYLLMKLDHGSSTELNRLLDAIITAETTGRTTFPTHVIEIFTNFFTKPEVPVQLKERFLKLVVSRSRNVAALSVLDQLAYYRTFQRILPELSTKKPEILEEAGVVYAHLRVLVSRTVQEANESSERIKSSADPLGETVAEAERATEKTTKYGFYRSAARLALQQKKFVYAVDLMEKASEIDISRKGLSVETLKREFDQFYREVVTNSLASKEPTAATYAVKKMDAPLSKAEGFRNLSKYYVDTKDLDAARSAHDEAIKLIWKTESSHESVLTLLRMLPTTQKIDPVLVLDLTETIAKSIDRIPTLNADDKPETENYKDYVAKMMAINLNLRATLTELVSVNRNAASDIAQRINRKEVKIIADLVLSLDQMNNLPKPKTKAASAAAF